MIGSCTSISKGRRRLVLSISERGLRWRSCSVMKDSSPVSLRRRSARLRRMTTDYQRDIWVSFASIKAPGTQDWAYISLRKEEDNREDADADDTEQEVVV